MRLPEISSATAKQSLVLKLKPRFLLLWLAVAGLCAQSGAAFGTAREARPPGRVGTLQIPGRPLGSFDTVYVNARGVFALSDRSNRGLDFFSAASGKFLGRAGGFRGYDHAAGPGHGGPDGSVAVGPSEFWAGDGDSTVKVTDVRSMKIVASIDTGGHWRADSLAYDPRDHLVVAANDSDKPPFISFISTGTRRVAGRLEFPHATDGLEQPLWDPATGLVYLSIPAIDHVPHHGVLAVIDPRARKLVKFLPVGACEPSGLALGLGDELLIGCDDKDASRVMSVLTGKIVARLPQVGGVDQVWSDRRTGRYYLAAYANPGGPTLAVFDLRTNRWIANVPTGPHAHSVAADVSTGKVFVPIAAGGPAGDCANGCVAVYGPQGK